MRRLLAPRWLAFHLLVVAAVVTMVSLAGWQWDRHQERVAFNSEVTARLAAEPVELADLLAVDIVDAQWRAAIATGTYLADEDLSIVNVSQDGRAGYDPVSALQLADGSIVLVVRGFVPLDAAYPEPPAGEVRIVGRLRASSTRRLGAVADPASGELREIQRIDIERLAPQMPAPLVDGYLELLASDPPDDPRLSRLPVPDLTTGPHLSYVGQWTVFSVAVLVGWVLVVRRNLRRTD